MFRLCACIPLLLFVFAGCGSQDIKTTPREVVPAEAAKSALKDIASTGQAGSTLDVVRENLTKLKTTDPAKAEGLLMDLDQLTALPPAKTDAIKAKAQEMVGKL